MKRQLLGSSIKVLVSVKNATEARIVGGQVDIIDIKNPDRGSLGRPDANVVDEVISAVGIDSTFSIALGELAETTIAETKRYLEKISHLRNVNFVKFGLSHSRGIDWKEKFLQLRRNIPTHITTVPATYADFAVAEAPFVDEVIEFSSKSGCSVQLVDTYHKNAGSIFDQLGKMTIRDWVISSRKYGTQLVLAGSIKRSDLTQLVDCAPDYVGVRGAVCYLENRTDEISSRDFDSFLSELRKLNSKFIVRN